MTIRRKVQIVLVLSVFTFILFQNPAIFPDNNQASIDSDQYLYRIYDSNLGKYGYIDDQGNVVIKPQFDYGQEVFSDLGWVEVDEEYRYIDKSEATVIQTSYDGDVFDWGSGEFHEGIALIETDEGMIGLNRKGEKAFVVPDESVFGNKFSEGLACVSSYDKDEWGFINMKGEMEIGPFSDQELEYAGDFHEGLAAVWKNEALGYMDKNGKMRIKPQYSYASDFSNGTAVVGKKRDKNNKIECILINKKGKILKKSKQRWDVQGRFSEGLGPVKMLNEYGLERYSFIDKDFKLICDPKFNWCSRSGFTGGMIFVEDRDSGLRGYINTKGEWIYNWGGGRELNFIFRDTTQEELIQTLESLGAHPLKKRIIFLSPADPVRMSEDASRAWVYPSDEQRLLLIGLENSMRAAEIGMIAEDISKWRDFEIDLWGSDSPIREGRFLSTSATLYLYIFHGNEAEQSLREFALQILEAHPGGVCDYDHGHAWTIEEIRSNAVIKGVNFIRQLEKLKNSAREEQSNLIN